ncbi:hypothetical protein GTA26_24935 [Rhodococcus hoagii]|nr:hypothetical protein [Prescottella equi]
MRFGLFVPQGWRLDLVGIDPADQWGVMRDVALRADNGPWESIWVYDHFHTVPEPTDEATHEAWSLMAAFAAVVGALLMGLTLAPVHVVVDDRGLETRYVLTGGRRRIPLDEIARADTVHIGLINRYGGIGYRVGPDGVGLLVRPGEALRVTRGDGSKFTVTVDGADQAAAVLNSLAARGRVAR